MMEFEVEINPLLAHVPEMEKVASEVDENKSKSKKRHGFSEYPRKLPKKGSRRYKRLMDLKHLLDLCEELEVNEDEIFPVHGQAVSIFSTMTPEEEEKWGEFLEMNEHEQQGVLKNLTEYIPKPGVKEIVCRQHPEHSFFTRINRRIRIAYRSTNLPMGRIECMEKELVECFGKNELEKYEIVSDCSFNRLIMHGICQYYNLSSRSSDVVNECGQVTLERRVVIHNKAFPSFTYPPLSLVEYIEKHLCKQKCRNLLGTY